MEINLPESLDVDYTADAARSTGSRHLSEADRVRIHQFINLIRDPRPPTRSAAIVQLNKVYLANKKKGPDLGLLLWNSPGITYVLLQEFSEGHRMLSPPRISVEVSIKICNALILFQCMASNPEARIGLIEAEIPQYFYPFLATNEKQLQQFDHLRLAGLLVIRELLKKDYDLTTKIVHYLLKIDTFPMCLQCMDVGDESTKSVAAFVIGKILKQQEGKIYIGKFIDRFVGVSKSLSKMVDEFTAKPPTSLLKNILICYMRLSEMSKSREMLRECYPAKLKDDAYLDEICEEGTKDLAQRVRSKCE